MSARVSADTVDRSQTTIHRNADDIGVSAA